MPDFIAARRGGETTRAAIKKLNDSLGSTMVMRDSAKPRDTFLLVRGVYDQPDKSQSIQPGVPASLPGLAKRRANRLDLAQWLTDPDHPLTARVTVNRYWQHFFGIGLVKTTEDFGVQGERPEHHRLLDWLATEFVQSGWNVKHLHRLIVTSAAYRQASAVTPELLERDPQNRLIARGPRHRMTAQAIRDQALAISGNLWDRMGGPPVKPYQPPGVWSDFSYGKIVYKRDGGEALYRRSLYTIWKRTSPPPSMVTFDASRRSFCVMKRQTTTTPLQALVLMNDPQYVEAGRKLAERMLTEGGASVRDQLQFAFRLLTSRHASDRELDVLENLYQTQVTRFDGDMKSRDALLTVGDSRAAASLPKSPLAAHAVVAGMLMSYDQCVMKR